LTKNGRADYEGRQAKGEARGQRILGAPVKAVKSKARREGWRHPGHLQQVARIHQEEYENKLAGGWADCEKWAAGLRWRPDNFLSDAWCYPE